MARTTINSQGVPVGTITASDLSYPLADFSSTGIDDNASSNAITISSGQAVTMSGLTYPTSDGSANQVLTTDGSGALTFADTSSGGVEYVAKTTTYTASANEGIIANTSGGAWTLTLPASPSTGDKVFVADGGDWSTNNLTVARNGSTVEGSAADFVMDYGGVNVGFIYDGSTWQVYPQAGLLQLIGIDDNATSTALTISSTGEVGIGTASPENVGGGADLAVIKSGGSRLVLNNTSRNWALRGDSGSDDLRLTLRGSSDTTDVDVLTFIPSGYATFKHGASFGQNLTIGTDGTLTGSEGGEIIIKSNDGTANNLVIDVAGTLNRFFTTTDDVQTLIGQLLGTGGQVKLYTEGLTRLTIGNTGNVGIGSPAASGAYALLDVDGTPTLNNLVASFGETINLTGYQRGVVNINGRVAGTDYDASLGFVRRTAANNNWLNGLVALDNSGAMYFSTGGAASSASTERLRITSTGKVGIGTNNPSQKLHIYEDALGVNIKLQNNDGTYEIQKYSDDIYLNLIDTGDVIWRMGTTLTESMRITSTRKVIHQEGAFFHGETAHDTASITGSSSITTSGIATSNSTFAGAANEYRTWLIIVRVHYNSAVYYHEAVGSCVLSGIFWNNSGTAWHDIVLNHHNAGSVACQIQFDNASSGATQELRIKTISGSFAFTGGVYFTGIRLN